MYHYGSNTDIHEYVNYVKVITLSVLYVYT